MGTGLPRQTLTSCFLVSGHVALTLVPFAPAAAKSKMMKRKKGNQESQAPSDPGPRRGFVCTRPSSESVSFHDP